MNPQLLFNSSLVLITFGLILLFKGLFLLAFTSLAIAIGISLFWLMSGFFGKFEYEAVDTSLEEERDDEGKGVLKPF
tara:strand:- start:3905 stop:4135 length:231 start_codon:yes stop_codon:yes gene_type:complete